MFRIVIPSLILAVLLMVSTWFSVYSTDYGLSPLLGPFLFVAALLLTGIYLWMATGNSFKIALTSIIFGGTIITVALINPSEIASLMPMIGGGAAFCLLQCHKHKHCC